MINQRRAQHEPLRVSRVEVELLNAAQILLRRRGSHLFKQARVAFAYDLYNSVVQMLAGLKVIPARPVERLSKDCLIRRGQRRQNVFHGYRTEAIRQELKTGLENATFDFHCISLGGLLRTNSSPSDFVLGANGWGSAKFSTAEILR